MVLYKHLVFFVVISLFSSLTQEVHPADKIAILDPRIQAPGLISVFPDADYYVISYNGSYDLNKTPNKFYSDYKFEYCEEIENINDVNYDAVFIVYAVNDFADKSRGDVQHHLEKILNILSENTFKKVVFFANDDHERDPALECPYIQADVWFKRNYSETIKYSKNVVPFPFLIFGWICPLWKVLNLNFPETEKIDRVLWGGGTYPSVRPDYIGRDRFMDEIGDYVEGISVPNDVFLKELSRSKFCLDLNGYGDPNIRTLEILCANSLLMQQFKHLVWPFEGNDDFSEETIFVSPSECLRKIELLRSNKELYDQCLKNQIYIKNKYFCKEWLSNYVFRSIELCSVNN